MQKTKKDLFLSLMIDIKDRLPPNDPNMQILAYNGVLKNFMVSQASFVRNSYLYRKKRMKKLNKKFMNDWPPQYLITKWMKLYVP